MVLNKDFKEFIESLNAHSVRYLIVGGYAVALHGHPRYTKDLDIWIWLEIGNAERLLEAVHDFGFGSLDLKTEDFLDAESVIQLGYPPARIDLMMDLKGVDFESCYDHRVEVNVEGVVVNFIDAESLKKNKKATGRAQDLADLEDLG